MSSVRHCLALYRARLRAECLVSHTGQVLAPAWPGAGGGHWVKALDERPPLRDSLCCWLSLWPKHFYLLLWLQLFWNAKTPQCYAKHNILRCGYSECVLYVDGLWSTLPSSLVDQKHEQCLINTVEWMNWPPVKFVQIEDGMHQNKDANSRTG